MKMTLSQTSILNCQTEAIVNAANAQLLRGGGLSGIIHKAAGDQLFEYLKKWKSENGVLALQDGEAIISPSFNLGQGFIVHAVGAVWREGSQVEKDLLKTCYINSLKLADIHKIKSIAFPNISTGIYGFPKEVAAQIAIAAVRSYDSKTLEEVVFACFDLENYQIYASILN